MSQNVNYTRRQFTAQAIGSIAALGFPTMAASQVTAFRQAVAETAARDSDLARFYRERGFEGIWTRSEDLQRRRALLNAFSDVLAHGLPLARYEINTVRLLMEDAKTPAEQGRLEVGLSQLFLQYARDIQTGLLTPSEVDSHIVRTVQLRDRYQLLSDFIGAEPIAFFHSLAPQSPEYSRLMREKMRLEALIAQGGWGPELRSGKLQSGHSGRHVIALRNKLISMEYLQRTVSQDYDDQIVNAVLNFQQAHGLSPDGTVGEVTRDQLNVSLTERLQSVVVAMERERWTNMPRGDRHVWVNLTDFSATIVDHDLVTFSTRAVIGAGDDDRQSPEFSDMMEHMVINPSWYVPRSITTREYLPQIQRNRNAVQHLQIINNRGQVIDRSAINFANYTEKTFPFSMRQPPSQNNALGLVKFMFPNKYNIYLHDTPAKSLFGREVRAFSHGCIRLNDPFDFAYHLLARQTEDPEGFFQSRLRTGAESRVNLEQKVPVHLAYRTAFTNALGQVQFRRDIYGRDARIWSALAREGVVVNGYQG